MPVEVPKECKDIEPLVRYLEERKFKIKEVGYNKDINSCHIRFYQPEYDKYYKEFSKIDFHIDRKIYLEGLEKSYSEIVYNKDKKTYDVKLTKLVDSSIEDIKIELDIDNKRIEFFTEIFKGVEELLTYKPNLRVYGINKAENVINIVERFF